MPKHHSRSADGAEQLHLGRWHSNAEDARLAHEMLKRTRAGFARGVLNLREFPGESMLLGECPVCYSTIAIEVEK